tara:strand:- start:138 stop:1682 length:1545 start_codon:yes stop_codon:yes gene_type:complete
MASVAEIAPLDTPSTGNDDVKKEITKLANTIIKSSTDGLRTATQTVVKSVPEMISKLTKEIENGPVDTFAISMNKLVKLVDKLGINLGDYNKKLGQMVDKARGTQQDLQKELHDLREKGFMVEIDQREGVIKWLTQKDVQIREEQILANEKQIKHLETVKRLELEQAMEKAVKDKQDTTDLKKQRVKNEDDIQDLKEKNEEKKSSIRNPRVDTGFSGNDQGFGKIAELKEAFMVVPDTIAEVFGSFKNIGKVLTTAFVGFFKNPMKTIKNVFRTIANVFKIARVAIALKVMGVIMVFQWIAEKLGAIGDVFQSIWNKITGFFKAIGDWFKNSWIGRKLGLGGDEEEGGKENMKPGELSSEGTGKFSQMDDGTYEIGNEPGTNKKDMIMESDEAPKWYKPWTWGKDKKEEKIVPSINKDVESELMSAPGEGDFKSIMKTRSVIGQTADGEKTPQKLEDLQKELKAYEERNVIQINNNSSLSSNNSSGTTVSGFVDHEPDTSFKYIRNNNSDSNWV